MLAGSDLPENSLPGVLSNICRLLCGTQGREDGDVEGPGRAAPWPWEQDRGPHAARKRTPSAPGVVAGFLRVPDVAEVRLASTTCQRLAEERLMRKLSQLNTQDLFDMVKRHSLTAEEQRIFVDNFGARPQNAEEDCDVLTVGPVPPLAGFALGCFLRRCQRLEKLQFEGDQKDFMPKGLSGLLIGLAGVRLEEVVNLGFRNCDIPALASEPLGRLMAQCPRLAKVELDGNEHLFSAEGLVGLWTGIGGPTQQRELAELQELGMRECKVSWPELPGFIRCCPKLAKVKLDGNTKVSRTEDMVCLTACPLFQDPQRLVPECQSRIPNDQYQDVIRTVGVVVSFFLQAQPRATTLEISGYGIDNHFMTEGLTHFVKGIGDAQLDKVQRLHLRGCNVSVVASEPFGVFLKRNTRLETLDADGNKLLFTPEALSCLAAGIGDASLPELVELSLRHCDIKADAGRALGSLLSKCPRLSRLHFNGNSLFTSEGLRDLELGLGRSKLRDLTELDLLCCDIPATSGEALGRFLPANCPHLASLNLSHNKGLCTNEGFQGLAAGVGEGGLALVTLQLRCCDITAEAAVGLGRLLLRCRGLERLQLSGNPRLATNEGLDGLTSGLGALGLQHLTDLRLGDCGVLGVASAQPSIERLLCLCPRLSKSSLS